jgi:hypothetical protein
MTRRREVITLLGGAAAWPLAARAQQPDRVRRIGVLMSVPESDPEGQAWLGTFSKGLHQLGWTAGRNIRLDYRWAAPFDAESANDHQLLRTTLSGSGDVWPRLAPVRRAFDRL